MEATPRPWTLFRETYIVGGDDDCIGATDGLDKGDAEAKANAAFIVKAANAHDRLIEALEAARGALVDESYGPFPGGDPRSFEPDHEVCTAEEIEAHRLACIAWDKGEGEDRGPSCATFGDGSAWTGTGYGVGTYTWEHDVVPAIDAALALARGEVE